MATLSWQCPLCCKEKFTTIEALKAHISQLLDDITCPICEEKLQKEESIIGHLQKCDERLKSIELTKSTESSNIKTPDLNLEDSCVSDGDPVNLMEIVDDPRLKNDQNENTGVERKTSDVDATQNAFNTYFCELCSFEFDDVDEHMKIYHEGQTAILQKEEEYLENQANTAVALQLETLNDGQMVLVNNTFEITNAPIFSATNTDVKPVKPKVIDERSVKDKDGRIYTQKTVKIDKFWTENVEHKLQEPTIQKYRITNGGAHPITDEEIATLDDPTSIIAINECPDCKLLFPILDHYLAHECAAAKGILKCTLCTFTFNEMKEFRTHMKSHKTFLAKNPRSYACGICNTVLKTSKSLQLHQRMHEPNKKDSMQYKGPLGEQKTFVCDICHKKYDAVYEEAHMKTHNPGNGYNCEVCNRKFHTESNLSMHMKAHTNNKKFFCSNCRQAFVTYESLTQHIKNQCQLRPYACQFCGRRFSRPHEKVKHERIHTGEKPHVCEICGKAFRVSYCLTLHLRTHSNTRPYLCKVCGKRFKSHSVFNHHSLTHSDVRAYKCPFCPKAFKTCVQLAGHKNCHIKPFTCTICNRPFASLYAVRAHMESHEKKDCNTLKYECNICGALYTRAFALKDHIKEQHPNEAVKIAAEEDLLEEAIDDVSAALMDEEEPDGIEFKFKEIKDIEITDGDDAAVALT